MIWIDLTNGKDNIHALVDVGNEGVFGVYTEVAGEFAEGLEVLFVVEEVLVGEDSLCADRRHLVAALEALVDEVDPLD